MSHLTFRDNLDPRVKSSLYEEELVFPPYNALQLQSILKARAKEAFKNYLAKPTGPKAWQEGVKKSLKEIEGKEKAQ